jgi:hypothetical protein
VLAAREATITGLVGNLVRSAGATPVQIMPLGPTWLTGANPAALAPLAAGVSVLAYGAPPVVAETVAQAQAHITDGTRLLIGLSLLHPDTADRTTFFNALAGVRRAGIQRVGLYNYGLSSTERLQWVRQALASSRDEAP